MILETPHKAKEAEKRKSKKKPQNSTPHDLSDVKPGGRHSWWPRYPWSVSSEEETGLGYAAKWL